MMLAAPGYQQDQGAAIWIAAFDDRSESAFGFGLPDQPGRLQLGGKAFSQAGTRQDR